jgi:hypothetical protein
MLDLTAIMFSTIIMLFVLVRAVHLDRIMPWFKRASSPPAKPAAGGRRQVAPRPWRQPK